MLDQEQRWLIISNFFSITRYHTQFPLTWNPITHEYGVVKDFKKLSMWLASIVLGIVFGLVPLVLKLCRIIPAHGRETPWVQQMLYIMLLLTEVITHSFCYAIFNHVESFKPFKTQIALLEENLQLYRKYSILCYFRIFV